LIGGEELPSLIEGDRAPGRVANQWRQAVRLSTIRARAVSTSSRPRGIRRARGRL